jgi:hypothetical protein
MQILEYFGLIGSTPWLFLLYESIFFFVFMMGAWLCLEFKPQSRR